MPQTYLLIHPERFPSHDLFAIADEALQYLLDLPAFDALYGATVVAGATACTRKIAVVDDYEYEEIVEGDTEELTCGVPTEGWEFVVASPLEIVQKLKPYLKNTTDPILVGGYSRHDCVRRAVASLRRAGHTVSLHEPAVLPLTPEAALPYLLKPTVKTREL